MKKIIFLLTLYLCIAEVSTVQAQKCFEKGNVLLNPGIGYGTRVAGSGFFWPNFSFSADFGVHDYVSVGPYTAFAFGGNGFNAFAVGARSSFHWWQLLDDKVSADLKQEQVELYFTVFLGTDIITFKGSKGNVAGFDAGATFGCRWYPKANDRFALFGEWGRGPLSFGTIGATIKVK